MVRRVTSILGASGLLDRSHQASVFALTQPTAQIELGRLHHLLQTAESKMVVQQRLGQEVLVHTMFAHKLGLLQRLFQFFFCWFAHASPW